MRPIKPQNNSNIKAEKLISQLLTYFGEDIQREGLRNTPFRVIRMYEELLSGYKTDPKSLFTVFESNGYEGLVVISDIKFYSLCEHHLVPFHGKVHIGYVPNGKILGISKFARLVDIFAKRLQIQEQLTNQIAESIMDNLHPKGVVVYTIAEHLCISMRGVKKDGSTTKAISNKGIFHEQPQLIDQFYRQLNHHK